MTERRSGISRVIRMDRETIFKYVSIVLAAVALILGIVTCVNVGNVKKSISFDTSVDVAVADPGMGNAVSGTAAEPETEQSSTIVSETGSETGTESSEAAAENSTEAPEQEAAGAVSGSTNIILKDGSLKLVNSYIRVPKVDAETTSEDLFVYLEGENTVRYDSGSDYLVVNDQAVVKTINAIDATYNGISEFTGADGTPILIGERRVSDTSAIAVVYTLGSAESTEEDIAKVQSILNNAKASVRIETFTIFGQPANPDFAQDIVMTDKAVELTNGSDVIYISPYTGTFASGNTSPLTAGAVTMTYNSEIMDSQSGYIPYIYEFSADQNGVTSTGSDGVLMAKFLAQKNLQIINLFEF